MLIKWNETKRDNYAKKHPGCQIPATGWVTFDANLTLTGASKECFKCNPQNGFGDFVSDLAIKAFGGKKKSRKIMQKMGHM